MRASPAHPRMLILSSPSGAGKSTLAARLRGALPEYQVSISHTTRQPRPGEVHGREYVFVDHETFDRMIARGEFVEWAHVHTNRYGTSRAEIERILAAGNRVLFDIDWQGTAALQAIYSDAVSVFVLPPSMAVLAGRLWGRKSDDPHEIRVRLGNARRELREFARYDHLIVNDELDAAFADLLAIVHGQPSVRPEASASDVQRLLDEPIPDRLDPPSESAP